MFSALEVGLCFGHKNRGADVCHAVSNRTLKPAPPRAYCGQGKIEEKSRLFDLDVKLFALPPNRRFLIVFLTLHRA